MAETGQDAAPLQLLAADGEDLKVISAALQDAVGALGDIRFEKGPRRLTIAFNRFRWESGGKRGGERVRAALQLGGVLDVKSLKLKRDAPKAVVSLMAIGFEPGEAPGGTVVLSFAGGGELRATVECLDAVLADLSRPWPTPNRPAHDLGS